MKRPYILKTFLSVGHDFDGLLCLKCVCVCVNIRFDALEKINPVIYRIHDILIIVVADVLRRFSALAQSDIFFWTRMVNNL